MATPEPEEKKISLAKLLKYGVDPNSLSFEDSGERRTLLCLAIEEAVKIDNYEKIDVLLKARADPCRVSENGAYPLQLAVKNKCFDLCRELLRAKADAKQADAKLVTPIHNAVHLNHIRLTQLLLMHKANVNAADRLGQTPVYFCSSRDVMVTLLEHEADLLHLNKKGQSPLHLAAHCGHYDIVAFLSDHDVTRGFINLQDEHGRTPLHHASAQGHQDCVSRLMDVGGDPKIQTNNGHTAMTLADAKNHLDVAYYIYVRTTGGNKSSWKESMHNPVFLTTAAIMGVACLVNRQLLWEFTLDLFDILRSRR